MKDRPTPLSDLPIARAFSVGAAEYDGLRRRLVPCFDAFYGTALEVIAAAEDRMRFDRCATLADQLAWLAATGFMQVDRSFKAWQFAVYSGQKPA